MHIPISSVLDSPPLLSFGSVYYQRAVFNLLKQVLIHSGGSFPTPTALGRLGLEHSYLDSSDI